MNQIPEMKSERETNKVSLEVLAKMTGFPIEMIQEEIFKGQDHKEISLEDLRAAMLSYIDTAIMVGEEEKR